MAILKLAGLLRPRNQLLHKRLPGEGVRDSIWQHAINTLAGFSNVRQNIVADAGKLTGRVFAPYSVFKGKAALSAEPRLPTFSKLDSGGVKLNRRGVIMLTFWPSVGERKYDWEKRQYADEAQKAVDRLDAFHSVLCRGSLGSSLSALLGRVVCFISNGGWIIDKYRDQRFFNAGQVRKSLSFKPNADGTGYFISLSVVNNNLKTNDRFTVPVTTAEFAVMRTAFSFALPHIMGWDRFTNQPSESISQTPSKVVPQLMETEWDR